MEPLPKFNDIDRNLIIQEIARIQSVELHLLKPSRKLYQSNKESVYLISGGTGYWHGINKQVVDRLRSSDLQNKENVFIVAKNTKPNSMFT